MVSCCILFHSVDATDEPRKGENSKPFGRLINHSKKEPNVVANVVEIDNTPHLCFFAIRKITIGEELQYDYGDRGRMSIADNPWLLN